MRPMGIVELKTTATGFTFVALMAVGRESFTPNLILIATVAARNSDSYHTIKTNSPYLGHDQIIDLEPDENQTLSVTQYEFALARLEQKFPRSNRLSSARKSLENAFNKTNPIQPVIIHE